MSPASANTVYTIGHSNQTFEEFAALLRAHEIQAIADVRSAPYSRYNPQFDREALRTSLREAGLTYVFLGKELGARTDDYTCYIKGKVQYDLLARTANFQAGLARVREGSQKFRLALMCAEKEPLDCHRSVLVSRHLVAAGLEVCHVLADGTAEAHAATMTRMMAQLRLGAEAHLFRSEQDLLDDAYRLQEGRIAFEWNTAAGSAA